MYVHYSLFQLHTNTVPILEQHPLWHTAGWLRRMLGLYIRGCMAVLAPYIRLFILVTTSHCLMFIVISLGLGTHLPCAQWTQLFIHPFNAPESGQYSSWCFNHTHIDVCFLAFISYVAIHLNTTGMSDGWFVRPFTNQYVLAPVYKHFPLVKSVSAFILHPWARLCSYVHITCKLAL